MPKLASACSATVRSAALDNCEFQLLEVASIFGKGWTCLNHFLFDFILFLGRMLNIFPRETVHYKKFKQLYPRLVERTMANRSYSKFVNAYQSRK